jgi:MFS family permease
MTRDLFLVATSLFTWGLGEGIFFYFQPLYLQKLGASPVAIGAILGGAALLLALSQMPVGYLGDRIGRRPFMYASWILGTIAAWIMAGANSLSLFVPGLLLYALTGFVTPPMNSYITQARGNWSVARALTTVSAAYNLGMVAGPFIGGKIAEVYGLKMLYFLAAIIYIISTIIIFFISDQPVEKTVHVTQTGRMLRNPQFTRLMGVVFLVVFATYLPQSLSSNYLQNERSLSFVTIGILGSVGSLGNTLLALSIGLLHSKRGYLIAQVAVLIFCLSLWLGNHLPWFIIGYFFLGGYKVCRSLSLALTRPIIHESQMGTAYGFMETVASTAIILAPVLAGVLYQVQPVLMYPVSAALVVISIFVSVLYLRNYNGSSQEPVPIPDTSPE